MIAFNTFGSETTSHSNFLQRRKEDFARTGVEIIVIPLGRLPQDMRGREKAVGAYVILD